jgi:hypothetical protein
LAGRGLELAGIARAAGRSAGGRLVGAGKTARANARGLISPRGAGGAGGGRQIGCFARGARRANGSARRGGVGARRAAQAGGGAGGGLEGAGGAGGASGGDGDRSGGRVFSHAATRAGRPAAASLKVQKKVCAEKVQRKK